MIFTLVFIELQIKSAKYSTAIKIRSSLWKWRYDIFLRDICLQIFNMWRDGWWRFNDDVLIYLNPIENKINQHMSFICDLSGDFMHVVKYKYLHYWYAYILINPCLVYVFTFWCKNNVFSLGFELYTFLLWGDVFTTWLQLLLFNNFKRPLPMQISLLFFSFCPF